MPAVPSASSAADAVPRGLEGQDGLNQLERDFVGIFVGLAGALGLPRSYGEIYGVLYASPRALSFTDLQGKLGLSKGSISQGLKALREVGAVRSAEGDDPRREHFV